MGDSSLDTFALTRVDPGPFSGRERPASRILDREMLQIRQKELGKFVRVFRVVRG